MRESERRKRDEKRERECRLILLLQTGTTGRQNECNELVYGDGGGRGGGWRFRKLVSDYPINLGGRARVASLG